jgi:hypothetical protein
LVEPSSSAVRAAVQALVSKDLTVTLYLKITQIASRQRDSLDTPPDSKKGVSLAKSSPSTAAVPASNPRGSTPLSKSSLRTPQRQQAGKSTALPAVTNGTGSVKKRAAGQGSSGKKRGRIGQPEWNPQVRCGGDLVLNFSFPEASLVRGKRVFFSFLAPCPCSV